MEYETLSTRYTGGVASTYEAERTGSKEWPKEQAAVERFLATLGAGSSIIDIPVGTGRFIPFYKKFDLVATGLDISPDMLMSSQEKATALNLGIKLSIGDIRHIDAPDGSFDTALCVRFVNWIDFAGMEASLTELTRVARRHIILSVRVWPTPQTLIERIGQAWTSFRRRRAELHFHNKEATLALFARLGLKIVDSEIVRQRSDQTEVIFYLLSRTA